MVKESCLISVVICTYNRCDLLKSAINTLIDQRLYTDFFEIIIVDNNSTDTTRDYIQECIMQNPRLNIRYILEPNQGLSHARNRGWREAHGEYIAYTDDDCEIPGDWLENAYTIIKEKAPSIFGGPYYPFYVTPKPRWFKDEYGSHSLGDLPRELAEGEFLSGGNIFFRKSLLEKIGGFNPDLGMVGNKIAYGEETALQIYVRKHLVNELIFYHPDLYVFHLVAPYKMSLKGRFRQKIADGRYSYLVFSKNSHNSNNFSSIVKRIIISSYWLMRDMFRGIIRDRSKYPYLENYLIECIFTDIGQFGYISEQINHYIGRNE